MFIQARSKQSLCLSKCQTQLIISLICAAASFVPSYW